MRRGCGAQEQAVCGFYGPRHAGNAAGIFFCAETFFPEPYGNQAGRQHAGPTPYGRRPAEMRERGCACRKRPANGNCRRTPFRTRHTGRIPRAQAEEICRAQSGAYAECGGTGRAAPAAACGLLPAHILSGSPKNIHAAVSRRSGICGKSGVPCAAASDSRKRTGPYAASRLHAVFFSVSGAPFLPAGK